MFALTQAGRQEATAGNSASRRCAPERVNDATAVPARRSAASAVTAPAAALSAGRDIAEISTWASDRPATAISSFPARVSRTCAACEAAGGERECAACDTGGGAEVLQAKPAGAALPGFGDVPPTVHSVLGSPGTALGAGPRAHFEPRFGEDFSGVHVHTDALADRSARDVGALAFTVGRHVVFRHGAYAPDQAAGKRLLAHELTHVVQQRGSAPDLQRLAIDTDTGSPAEREADRVATAIEAGGRATVAERSGGRARLSRAPGPTGAGMAAGGCGVCQMPMHAGTEAHRWIGGAFVASGLGQQEVRVFKSRGKGNSGRLDLAAINLRTRTIYTGEVKPNSPSGRQVGVKDQVFYRALVAASAQYGSFFHRNLTKKEWNPTGMPIGFLRTKGKPASCGQTLFVKPAEHGLYLYECMPPASVQELRPDCACEKGKKGKKKDKEKDKEKEKKKEKEKEKEKGEKEKEKKGASAKAGNVGFGISLFGESVGGANAGIGVSIGSNSAAFGTAGVGFSWFSDTAAAGTIGAGVQSGSTGAAAASASAGLDLDSTGASALTATAGKSEGDTGASAASAATGQSEGGLTATAATAGKTDAKNVTAATAAGTSSGKVENVVGAGTGSPTTPAASAGSSSQAPGQTAAGTKPAPAGGTQAAGGHAGQGQQAATGASTGTGAGASAGKTGGGRPGGPGQGGSTAAGTQAGSRGEGGSPGSTSSAAQGQGGQVAQGSGAQGQGGGKAESAQPGSPGRAAGTPPAAQGQSGGSPSAAGSATGVPASSTAQGGQATQGSPAQGTSARAVTQPGKPAGLARGGVVVPLGSPGASEAKQRMAEAEATQIALKLAKANASQIALMQHLVENSPGKEFHISTGDWVDRYMQATAGLTPEDVEYLKLLPWKPGHLTVQELRAKIMEALKHRQRAGGGHHSATSATPGSRSTKGGGRDHGKGTKGGKGNKGRGSKGGKEDAPVGKQRESAFGSSGGFTVARIFTGDRSKVTSRDYSFVIDAPITASTKKGDMPLMTLTWIGDNGRNYYHRLTYEVVADPTRETDAKYKGKELLRFRLKAANAAVIDIAPKGQSAFLLPPHADATYRIFVE